MSVTKAYLKQALKNIIASQQFEGLSPSEALVKELEAVIAGELTIKDVEANILRRINIENLNIRVE